MSKDNVDSELEFLDKLASVASEAVEFGKATDDEWFRGQASLASEFLEMIADRIDELQGAK